MRHVWSLILLTLAHHSAFAQTPSSQMKGTVSEQDKSPTYLAPSGQARITILAQGERAFMGRLWLAPHATVPLHQDPTEEYLHILEGEGTLSLNGVDYAVRAGMTIFMPAKAKVTFKNGDKPMVCLQVFAGPESAKKYHGWPRENRKTPREKH
ncbi:MAG: cupin domain-containing protein [Myxococcota bacterium]|nr:cupin domain-containing protein [Myxococcota bacterium]